MFASVIDYAGPTLLARLACLTGWGVFLVLVALFAFCLWKRHWKTACFPVPLLVLWGLAAWFGGPALDHAWLYLQQNVLRTHATYTGLTFATAFCPTFGCTTGRDAFLHLATRDSGFAKGKPVREWTDHGHAWCAYSDEDYPGGVQTMDGRPVHLGYRFRATRLLTALIPWMEMPSARRVRVVGAEASVYAEAFAETDVQVVPADDRSPVDIVLIAPSVDWTLGSDMPDAGDFRRLAKTLAKGGVVALHIDTRLMTRARFKGVLAEFRSVFTHYHLWCTGRFDYVLTSTRSVQADEVLELFENAKAFEAFTRADAVSPADVFACYVGTDFEVDPAFFAVPAFGSLQAKWTAPRLAFVSSETNHLAQVKTGEMTPYVIPKMDWLRRGLVEKGVFTALSNGIVRAQTARREMLVGFDEVVSGSSTNAIERWAKGAAINPRDPLLRNLADSLDLEGRRYLRLGNVNGAIRCYENRLLIWPKDVAAVHNFGVCLRKSGHHDVAASIFAKAVTMDPQTDEHRMELVECCAACNKEDIACRQLDVLMKRHPTEPSYKMRAAKLLCLKKNKVRDEDRAIKLAEEAVRLTGWKDRAYVHALADVYIESGRVLLGTGLKRKMKEMRFEK